MTRWKIFAVVAFVAALLLVGAAWFSWKPAKEDVAPRSSYLPPSSTGQDATEVAGDETMTVEGGTATSENYMLISSPPTKK